MNEFGIKENLGLTVQEKEIINNLKLAWNSYVELPNSSQDDLTDFRNAIHTTQRLIALRVARRIDPGFWITPE